MTTVEQFFHAQIEAAKAIQRQVMRQAASTDEPLDLVNDIRPALVRISARINQLICLLPSAVTKDEQEVLEQINQALLVYGLPDKEEKQLTTALLAIAGFSSSY